GSTGRLMKSTYDDPVSLLTFSGCPGPAPTVVHTANLDDIHDSRVRDLIDGREAGAYLSRIAQWISCDNDARSRHQRGSRGTGFADTRQYLQRGPLGRICRAVVHLENDQDVRVPPLGAFDSPLDRDFLALIVEKRMAVMRVCGGPGAYTDSRYQMNHHASF